MTTPNSVIQNEKKWSEESLDVRNMKNYYVYIATNFTNSVLYIGVTNNIERRMYEHKNKLVDGFTKKFNIFKLVYIEHFGQVTDAIAAEKKLKGWSRAKKNEMISQGNPLWRDLLLEAKDSTLRSE